MTETVQSKRIKTTRGPWRFVCVACRSEAKFKEGTFQEANASLGRDGWRIEHRNGWGLCCPKCVST